MDSIYQTAGEIGSTFSNIDFVIFTVSRLHPQLTTNCSQLEIEMTVGLIGALSGINLK